MCGIAGAYWLGKKPAEAEKIVDRMAKAIRHRGPDSTGRSSSQFAEVGFNRLSIIDLATGDQPLRNQDGSVECFLNGEIYNYLPLREELKTRGHVFHTSSDTEVLPYLYQELGEAMFTKLNGMFSICVIDHRRRRVILARDHFGVKQMYYSRTPQGVIFASEIKGILASGVIEPEIDEASLVPYLTLFYSPEPHTLLKGVKKLPAGSFLRLYEGCEVQPVKYYQLPTTPTNLVVDEEEAGEQCTELLAKSVRLQLQADVPVGVSLSGGLDSSAIAYLASQSRNSGDNLLALTISWPDTAPEEVACSKDLCRALGISQEILEPEPVNFEVNLPLLAWISDEPVADPSTYSQFVIAEAASRSVKVLLGGAGGDELFGGYGHHILPWKKAAYACLPDRLQQSFYHLVARRRIDEDSADALMAYKRSRIPWHCRYMRNFSMKEEAILMEFLPGSRGPFENIHALFNTYKNYDPVSQQMMVDLQSYLSEQLLPIMDRASMAASIEGRVPFLDVNLVEFCFSLKGKTKVGWPAAQKRLLKRALGKSLPKQIIRREKSGMPSHFSSFIARSPGLVRELLLGDEAYTKGVVPSGWLQSLLSSTEQMRLNFRAVYALVVLEVWYRLFVKEKIYDKPTLTLSDLFKISRRVLVHS